MKEECALGKVSIAETFEAEGTEGVKSPLQEARWAMVQRTKRRMMKSEDEVSLTLQNAGAILRSSNFILRAVGSRRRVLSSGVIRSDLYFKKITLVSV